VCDVGVDDARRRKRKPLFDPLKDLPGNTFFTIAA